MEKKIPYRQLQNLSFSVYRPQEIRKLSVIEITNPTAFDTLEHPLAGGLYDPHMGPSDYDEKCLTCGLSALHCPGHVGHIVLPLPVFNAVFIKTLYQILQGSCFKCHRLMAPPTAVTLALCQFEALDYGLVGTVQELSEAVSDLSSVTTNESTSMEGAVQEKLHTILLEATSSLDIKECKASSCTKSVVECRQRIMKEFIRTHMTKPRIKCPHCDAKKGKVALRNNSRFVLCNVSKEDSITAKNPGAVEESQGEVSKISERTATVNSPYTNIDLMPTDVKEHLNLLWKKESSLLKHLFGILNVSDDQCESPMNVFFTEMMIVPPTRFRPISVVKGRKFLNAQSAALKDVLTDAVLLKNLLRRMKGEYVSNIDEEQVDKVQGANDQEKLSYLWRQLQNHVNCVYDSDLDKLNKDKTSCGVKQVLEKKEGLFRKHMMGKRVNFAARSVISPDPYIMVDEIGVPTVFAKKLTYPTPVTDWNVEALRQAVINGPDVHPGAEKVEMEDGKIIKLKSDDPVQRRALACKLLTPPSSSTGIQQGSCKKVHRHLQNGDILLLNRQPTLHKPSIMAHKARVLPGEKTLRLHYANCKSYNADFDGDEMNAHYPQSELARAEGYHIVSVNHQYLVPKDGTPLSGLIQDHIIAGTLLTMRGRFFTREEYHQLVYGAIEFVKKSIRTLPPSIIKPKVLWSGKQVVSTVIINLIPEGKPPPTIEGKAKVSVKNWQNAEPRKWRYGGTPLLDISMSESEVVIHSGELLCGVIDKANIGPTPCGLIHCCYELYGGKVSTALLTALAKLFTHFLQIHTGFTLGIEDILLTEEADEKRWQVMRKAAKKGDKVVARAFNVDDPSDKKDIIQKFKQAHLSRDDNGLKMLDYEMKKTTDEVNNKINKICMPNGLMKKFPKNNLQLMVQSGAKGSTVNTMQISCLLGQIELEGRRVPLMLNGSTLPSFRPYDTSPRAGGFVDGRFLTGIKPQEFFFHCMAGREGLVDTAVKTSRSGYLQRCLIKHLEGIVVNYDLTVRDSDGSVIQFLYGEDGWDVCKMQMLKEGNLHLLAKNYDAVINEEIIENFIRHQELPSIPWHRFTGPEEMKRAISKWKRKYKPRIGKSRHSPFLKFAAADTDIQPNVHNRRSWLTTKWHHLDQMTRQKFSRSVRKCPDSVTSVYRPDLVFGAVSEKLDAIIEHYIKNKDYGIVRKHGDHANNNSNVRKYLSVEQFKNLAYYKSLNALAHPGEAVGLLAAQSIGEPSTQMTLNTFHFAGRGEMNVTLGIPRLREILMVASANIATPTMDLPLLNVPDVQEKAEKLRVKLSSVHLKQVLETIEVKEVLWVKSLSYRFRDYTVKMNFLPYEVYKGVHYATPGSILSFIEDVFIRDLISYTQKKLASLTSSKLVSFAPKTQKNVGTQEDMDGDQEERAPTQSSPLDLEERGSSDEEEGDGDTVSTKMKTRHTQDLEYEEPEPEEKAQDPEDDDDIEIIEADNTAGGEEDKEGEEGLAADQNWMLIQEKKVKAKAEKHSRVQRLKDKYSCLSHYDYDTKKMSWCEFTLRLNVQNSKLDMHTLVEEAATKAVLYSVPNIRKAFLVKNPNPENGVPKMLKTDGVNFLEVFKYVDIIDMKKVYSNDIHSIAKIYGIEAAARVIVNEIKNVFATYGIEVDPRHLLLIADYMTFDGTYKPCNRIGMASNASPLQQMSFETTMNFLQSAALAGSEEQLKSPSSRLVVGKLVGGGTGIFDLWQKFAHRS